MSQDKDLICECGHYHNAIYEKDKGDKLRFTECMHYPECKCEKYTPQKTNSQEENTNLKVSGLLDGNQNCRSRLSIQHSSQDEKMFLRFEEIATKGVTKKFNVYSTHSGDFLGIIKWNGGWRHYIMDYGNVIMSLSCNKQLNNFMEKLENERKEVIVK